MKMIEVTGSKGNKICLVFKQLSFHSVFDKSNDTVKSCIDNGTHNKGGYYVRETYEELMELVKNAKNLD